MLTPLHTSRKIREILPRVLQAEDFVTRVKTCVRGSAAFKDGRIQSGDVMTPLHPSHSLKPLAAPWQQRVWAQGTPSEFISDDITTMACRESRIYVLMTRPEIQ